MVPFKNLNIWLADKIAEFIGSWTFIITQSTILTVWIIINIFGIVHFDPYPFILLNLFLSFQAAYATPLILMSANRQAERDRKHLLHDLDLDEEANILIRDISKVLKTVSDDLKIDKELKNDHMQSKLDREQMKRTLEEIKILLRYGNNGQKN